MSHTIFHHTIFRTQLCHTSSFATPSFTHHFVTHHLSHTTLSHALFHTQLSHTPYFTHCFVTHLHTTSFVWQPWYLVTSTFVSRGRRGTNSHPRLALCVAGVAQTHIYSRFAWQAWHKLTSTFVLRGRRGTYCIGWRAWSGFVARDAAAVCVAAVVLGDIHLRFTWQAWHKLTSTVVLRGRRGTYVTGWRAWSGFVACDAAALCVAGVALGDIHLHFTWQVWHKLTSTVILRGRRGTHSHPPSFCVAGVALMVLGSG